MEDMGQSAGKRQWVAGFTDGEGCIYLQKRNRGNKNRSFDLIPEIIIVNSNWLNIEETDRVLKEEKIGHFIYSYKGYGVRPGKKPKWGIRISGFKRCEAFLQKIGPFLIGKQREAQVLMGYIISRLEKPQKCTPYSENEVRAYDELRMLKTMSNPNDYTLSSSVKEEKI